MVWLPTHPPPPLTPVPFFSLFSLLPHPFLPLTSFSVKGQHLIEHMAKKVNSCNAILTSRPPAVKAKMRKTRKLHLQRHFKTKICPWPSSIPPLHHPSLHFPSFSPWSCLHGNPLRASRPWVCACLVYVCVWTCVGREACSRHKTKGLFLSPVSPWSTCHRRCRGAQG